RGASLGGGPLTPAATRSSMEMARSRAACRAGCAMGPSRSRQQKVPFRGQAEQVGEEGGGEERPRPDHDPVVVARAHATLNTGYPSFVTASASSWEGAWRPRYGSGPGGGWTAPGPAATPPWKGGPSRSSSRRRGR